MDVLFELRYRFCAESVGYGFAFAGMLGAITGVEEAPMDGYEDVIVVAEISFS